MSNEEEVRLSVPIPKEINDKLNILLPWGLKAPAMRMLITLLLDAQRESGNQYIVTDLIEGRCKLVRTNDRSVQNLNKSNFEAIADNDGDSL